MKFISVEKSLGSSIKIEDLLNEIEAVKVVYPEAKNFEILAQEDYDYYTLRLDYSRHENEEERKQRTKDQEQMQRMERAQYERLKKKFEGE